jgi:hypothetical protein
VRDGRWIWHGPPCPHDMPPAPSLPPSRPPPRPTWNWLNHQSPARAIWKGGFPLSMMKSTTPEDQQSALAPSYWGKGGREVGREVGRSATGRRPEGPGRARTSRMHQDRTCVTASLPIPTGL